MVRTIPNLSDKRRKGAVYVSQIHGLVLYEDIDEVIKTLKIGKEQLKNRIYKEN